MNKPFLEENSGEGPDLEPSEHDEAQAAQKSAGSTAQPAAAAPGSSGPGPQVIPSSAHARGVLDAWELWIQAGKASSRVYFDLAREASKAYCKGGVNNAPGTTVADASVAVKSLPQDRLQELASQLIDAHENITNLILDAHEVTHKKLRDSLDSAPDATSDDE